MNLAEGLQDLLADEPAYALRPEEAVRAGRARLMRRRLAVGGGLLGLAAGAGAVVTLTVGGGHPATPTDSVLLASPTAATTPAAQPVAAHNPVEQALIDTLPAGWTISDLQSAPDLSYVGSYIDDGTGPGRVYVGLAKQAGDLLQHPCADSEFALGAACTETALPNGSRLAVRAPTAGGGPVTSTLVVIIHPDGTGVNAGADAATWPHVDLTPGALTPADVDKSGQYTVTRPLPPYSPAQLVALAEKVDAVS